MQPNGVVPKSRSCNSTRVMKAVVAVAFVGILATQNTVDAWKQCSSEEGGGTCPTGATCCPTDTPGVSSCIPGKEKDPEGARGQCCDPKGATGCAYGYYCAFKGGNVGDYANVYEKKQQEVCKLREPHPDYLNAKETPRYELCRLPSSSVSSEPLQLQAFPINGFNAVYYSSMGSIQDEHSSSFNNTNKFSSVETVLIIVHGSGRNADDYLCAGISTTFSKRDDNTNSSYTQRDSNYNKIFDINNRNTLVIAPKFVADVDHHDRVLHPNTLYWLEHGPNVPLGHTWRYGADAANKRNVTFRTSNRFGKASRSDHSQKHDSHNSGHEGDDDGTPNGHHQNGISSYAVMDRLVEFLIASKPRDLPESSTKRLLQREKSYRLPNLKRIVVAGHSAGGQLVHRWTLLSSSPIIWGGGDECINEDDRVNGNNSSAACGRKVEIRSAVANPRSYCYLDNRRMIRTGRYLGTNFNRYRGKNIDFDADVDNYDVINHTNTDKYQTIVEHDSYVFAIPDPQDVKNCPSYDQWQWGLERGGDVLSPYKDYALNLVDNNLTEVAMRYSKRRVFYLAGEHDTIVQEDRCETFDFQGHTRIERARRYFQALLEYFAGWEQGSGPLLKHSLRTSSSTTRKDTRFVHEIYQVPGSPHDHTLMFQSAAGREALFGHTQKNYVGTTAEKGYTNNDIILKRIHEQGENDDKNSLSFEF